MPPVQPGRPAALDRFASTRSALRILVGLVSIGLLAWTPTARAVEIEPFEYVPLPKGTNLQILYNYYDYADAYENPLSGTRGAQDARLSSYTAYSKTARYFDLGGYTALLSIIQAFGTTGTVRIGDQTIGRDSGIGDTTFGSAFWPVDDRAHGTAVGIGFYLTVPTGSYSAEHGINLGGNRFVYDPQLSLHQRLAPRWSIDLAADILVYGANSNYGASSQRLTQNPSFQGQVFLNYELTPTIFTSVGYEGLRGGVQSVSGRRTGARTDFDELRFSVGDAITPRLQILADLGHQFRSTGGFRQDVTSLLRIVYFF